MTRKRCAMENISLYLLVLMVPACLGLNYTDLGSRYKCEMPSVSFCAGVVNYKVPLSIAKQVEFIESNLMLYSTALSDNEQDCFEPSKRALCQQVFPKCDEAKNKVVFGVDSNCRTELQAGCTSETLQEINVDVVCSPREFELSGFCQPLREQLSGSSSAQILGSCALSLQTIGGLQLSDWMYHHMEVFGAFMVLGALPSLLCFTNHWWYLCYYGECSGQRVRTIVSREDCSSTMDCYPSDFSVVPLQCEVLPYTEPSSRPQKGAVWPPFVKQSFEWSGSMQTLAFHWTSLLLLSLFTTLWFHQT